VGGARASVGMRGGVAPKSGLTVSEGGWDVDGPASVGVGAGGTESAVGGGGG
jgi:hypothetical protein